MPRLRRGVRWVQGRCESFMGIGACGHELRLIACEPDHTSHYPLGVDDSKRWRSQRGGARQSLERKGVRSGTLMWLGVRVCVRWSQQLRVIQAGKGETKRMNGRNGQRRLTGISGIERPSGKPSAKKLRQLLEWQDDCCALTGRLLTPANCEVDHIVPVSGGGSNTMDNLQLVVSEANQCKRAMTQEDFVRLCEDVAALHGRGAGVEGSV